MHNNNYSNNNQSFASTNRLQYESAKITKSCQTAKIFFVDNTKLKVDTFLGIKTTHSMITYQRHRLDNGLQVLLHRDDSTPLVTVNLLYNVGARDEDPCRTGFAHLFEHLMFGGTKAVPDYDMVVNGMGGESNAFTNNDYTNYYLTVPAQMLDTALALEADRMRLLDFSPSRLAVQQQVVTEEYHQRYENQPYGDTMLLLRPLCYQRHPYRWPTIGSTIQHVQEATLDDVEQFFFRFYHPANCILSIAGNIDYDGALRLVQRHFADIRPRPEALVDDPQKAMAFARPYPQEETQDQPRRLEVQRPVPNDALYMAFPMCDRNDSDFFVYDLLSDVLSNGNSSRLYRHLVQERALFSELNAYITGEAGPGLFIVSGKPSDGVPLDDAESAVWDELKCLSDTPVDSHELQKVVNKFENTFVYSQYKVMDRAMSLCHYTWLGRTEWVNDEPQSYKTITPDDLQRVARQCFVPEHSNILYYHSQQ